MSLLSRLVSPAPGEDKLPVHQFMAAVAELKRAAPGVTVSSIATAFGLSAGEQTELESFLNTLYVDGISRELIHDVLMLGEDNLYTLQQCADRLVNAPAPTDLWSLVTPRAFEVMARGINGMCVVSGCSVSAQGSPDMTLAVAKGAVMSGGVLSPVTSGNVTITTAHATLPRIDLVVASSNGTKTVRAGTPAAKPGPPTLSAGDVCLAFVYVPPADTTIGVSQLQDTRVFWSSGSVLLGKVTSPVVRNNSNTAQTFVSITVPNGLFMAGKIIRVSMGGTMLFNSGTPTLTLRISYGGTLMFQDVTGSATADVDRLAWTLDFTLTAQANNDQNLNGTLQLGALGAKTAPNTGTGDISANGLSGVFNGSAAVDSDAANRDLVVEFTMSVANAANEIVMEYAVGEMLG